MEISPEYSLEGLMLKLKLQYFGHLMRRADSLEKTLMLGGIGGRRITKQIVNALNTIWEIDGAAEAREQIESAQATYNTAPGEAVEGFQPYANTHSYYTETLFAAPQTQSFLDKFNSDVIAEFGTNQEGGNKIHMIAFKE